MAIILVYKIHSLFLKGSNFEENCVLMSYAINEEVLTLMCIINALAANEINHLKSSNIT